MLTPMQMFVVTFICRWGGENDSWSFRSGYLSLIIIRLDGDEDFQVYDYEAVNFGVVKDKGQQLLFLRQITSVIHTTS